MLSVRPRRWRQFDLFSFRHHGIFHKVCSGGRSAVQRVLYIYSSPTSEPSPLQKTAFPLVKSRLALGPTGGFDVRSIVHHRVKMASNTRNRCLIVNKPISKIFFLPDRNSMTNQHTFRVFASAVIPD